MSTYVCAAVDNATNACVSWVVNNQTVFDELNSVTPDQFWSLFTKTSMVFLVAWGWNKIDQFITHH